MAYFILCYGDPQEREKLWLVKRRELEEEAAAAGQKLMLLDSTLKWLRKDGSLMDYDVTLKTFAPLICVSQCTRA